MVTNYRLWVYTFDAIFFPPPGRVQHFFSVFQPSPWVEPNRSSIPANTGQPNNKQPEWCSTRKHGETDRVPCPNRARHARLLWSFIAIKSTKTTPLPGRRGAPARLALENPLFAYIVTTTTCRQ